MTLLVASIKDQQAILLKDFQISTNTIPVTRTDELNKMFKKSFNEHDVYFLTAGSFQVWKLIHDTIDVSNLLFDKSLEEMDQAFKDYITSPVFNDIQEKGSGFIIVNNTTTNNFIFYKITFKSKVGGILSQLGDGIYSLGLGSDVIYDFQEAFHQSVWARKTDSLFQKKCNLESQIKFTFNPLDSSHNHYERTGVSETFSSILIENGNFQLVDEELIEGIASTTTPPQENEVTITHHENNAVEVQSSLSGTQQMKSYGEDLDRNGVKVERL